MVSPSDGGEHERLPGAGNDAPLGGRLVRVQDRRRR